MGNIDQGPKFAKSSRSVQLSRRHCIKRSKYKIQINQKHDQYSVVEIVNNMILYGNEKSNPYRKTIVNFLHNSEQ